MSALTKCIEKQIINVVRSATDFDQLAPMLMVIPIEKLQDCIISEISSNANTKKNVFHYGLSINDLLPDDIMQYILSFDITQRTKLISKTWRKLSNKNEEIKLKQRDEAVKQIQFKPNIEYDEATNKTWVVDENRSKLHDTEIKSGYNGPFRDINKAITVCESGDKILIHDGEYELDDHCLEMDKNIQFIGIGDNVTILDVDYGDDYYLHIDSQIYFENVMFRMDRVYYDYCIGVTGTLWIKNCVIIQATKIETAAAAIIVAEKADLNAFNCEFIDGTVAIDIRGNAGNVTVTGCKFIGYGQETHWYKSSRFASISIDCEYDENERIGELKCIGNIFKNNVCYPIAERHKINSGEERKYQLTNADSFCLSHNILKGYTAIKITQNLDFLNANTVYFNDADYRKKNVFPHCY